MCHSIDFKAYVYLNACKLFLRNEQLVRYISIRGGTAMKDFVRDNNIYDHFLFGYVTIYLSTVYLSDNDPDFAMCHPRIGIKNIDDR